MHRICFPLSNFVRMKWEALGNISYPDRKISCLWNP